MWITRLLHEGLDEVRLASIHKLLTWLVTNAMGSVFLDAAEGVCNRCRVSCYARVDRRWSANGGAAEASPEFAMVLARCIDEVGTLDNA